MSENITVNNQPFDEAELSMLNVLAGHIIPEDSERNLPSGSSVAFLDSLIENAPHTLSQLKDELIRIEQSTNGSFVNLPRSEQVQALTNLRIEQPDLLNRFAIHIYSCYYQDPRVLAHLGMEARAPFPKGYTDKILRGDLSLLDQVRERGPIWRPAE